MSAALHEAQETASSLSCSLSQHLMQGIERIQSLQSQLEDGDLESAKAAVDAYYALEQALDDLSGLNSTVTK